MPTPSAPRVATRVETNAASGMAGDRGSVTTHVQATPAIPTNMTNGAR